MDIVRSLANLLLNRKAQAPDEAPEGLCPNCWGRYEYGGQFYEAVKNNDVDIDGKNPNIGWIQDYANKHLYEIALKPAGDQLICSKCKITYRPI